MRAKFPRNFRRPYLVRLDLRAPVHPTWERTPGLSGRAALPAAEWLAPLAGQHDELLPVPGVARCSLVCSPRRRKPFESPAEAQRCVVCAPYASPRLRTSAATARGRYGPAECVHGLVGRHSGLGADGRRHDTCRRCAEHAAARRRWLSPQEEVPSAHPDHTCAAGWSRRVLGSAGAWLSARALYRAVTLTKRRSCRV